jgi:hypothetical protein
LPSRLLGREFYDLFQQTVVALADRLAMNWTIHDERFVDANECWKDESERAADEPDVVQFIVTALGNIAVAVCESQCVTYYSRLDQDGEIDPHRQSLLEEFASEYTAMEFVRARYFELYFAVRQVDVLPVQPDLINRDSDALARMLAQLRQNPNLARQYIDLLNLPVLL